VTWLMTGGWLDRAIYERTLNHGPCDWAWEFLRRNQGYVSDWQLVVRGVQGERPDLRTMAARFFALDAVSKWGVIFRGCSP